MSLERERFEKIFRLLLERLDRPPKNAELADLVHLSEYHFQRVFKQMTGQSPRRFQIVHRLRQASHLLLQTDQSVTDIALSVGYESSQAFSRMFREKVGCSPSTYRKQARPES